MEDCVAAGVLHARILTVLILGLTPIQVWYADSRHEVLATRLVLKLSSTTKWRKHLVALQGYVVPCRVESGLYRTGDDVIHAALIAVLCGFRILRWYTQ